MNPYSISAYFALSGSTAATPAKKEPAVKIEPMTPEEEARLEQLKNLTINLAESFPFFVACQYNGTDPNNGTDPISDRRDVRKSSAPAKLTARTGETQRSDMERLDLAFDSLG